MFLPLCPTLFFAAVFNTHYDHQVTEYGDYILEEARKESTFAYIRTLVSLYEAGHKLIKSLTVKLDQQELVDLMMMTFSKQASHYLECELIHLSTTYEHKLAKWKAPVTFLASHSRLHFIANLSSPDSVRSWTRRGMSSPVQWRQRRQR